MAGTHLKLAMQFRRVSEALERTSRTASDATGAVAPILDLIGRMRREAGLRDGEEFAEYPLPIGPLQVGMSYAETSYTQDGRPVEDKWHLQCLACDVAWVEDPDIDVSRCWLCERILSVPLARERYNLACDRQLDAAF